MGKLWMDVKYAARMLARSPGFTVVAVLTLALGIGANTVIFSVVSRVLLEPLPYAHGERLAIAVRAQPGLLRTIASYPDFVDWHESGVFAKAAAMAGRNFYLDTDEGAQMLSGRRVTEEFFAALGVRPALGRDFLPEEVRAGESVALVSHPMWTRRLGADPQAVGQDLRVRGSVFRIIGVLPENFVDPVSGFAPRDLYVPLVVPAEERGPAGRNSQWLQVIGQLRDGITLGQAAAQVQAISERAQREMQGRDVRALSPFSLIALREHQVGDTQKALWLLLGAVGFVLLIGCANVSNLLLARITARQHEFAVRAAVGASRGRLAAQLLTESLLLSALGATAALVFVLWGLDVVKKISPVSIPRLESAALDLRVFGFAFFAALVAGVIFGLLPMLRGARQEALVTLRQSGGTGGTAHRRMRNALLVAEMSLTTVLLVGSALAVTSFQRLISVDPGFESRDVLTVPLSYAGDWKGPQQAAFFEQLMERVRAMPGVRAAGAVDNLPYSGSWSQFTTTVDSFAESALPEMQGKKIEYQQGVVGGDYFRVMGVPLKAGRFFSRSDGAGGSPSVIVSESLARSLWGEGNPLGRELSDRDTPGARVVGVVGDVRHFGPEAQPVHTLYRLLAQREAFGGMLVVLASGDSAALVTAIRESVRALDRSVIVQRAQMMDELLESRTAAPRFLAVLLGGFAAFALLLAAIGIYGVLSYAVSQRRQEIGIRMALGARPGEVLWMTVRGGMVFAATGIAIGLAAALWLSRFMQTLLFEVSVADPMVYAGIAVFLAGVALLACWIPARRAARVDPMVALRYE